MSSIEHIICKGSQSLLGEAVDYGHQPRLRALVKRDSYDSQSHATVYAWTSSTGWEKITGVPIGHTAVAAMSYVAKDGEWEHLMRDDLDALLAKAYRFFSEGDENHATR